MQILLWAGFLVLVAIFLVIDLGVFNKKDHQISAKEALGWTGIWVSLALLFGGFVYYLYETNWMQLLAPDNVLLFNGKEALLKFYTGFLIEKSLSLDNIFVMAMVFAYFRIPLKYQHEVLFWGILGAMVFRGIMIFAGTALIAQFYWVNYLFGLLLLYSAIQMLRARHEDADLLNSPVVRFIKRFYSISTHLSEGKFFVMEGGKRAVTILFVALVVIETTDVLFAVDSIPAIFAITTDPFLVFTSNIFAILGLRSLYFVLADFMDRFRYLKYSLIFILAFVGVKIMLAHHYAFPTILSLGVIIGTLIAGIAASYYANRRGKPAVVPFSSSEHGLQAQLSDREPVAVAVEKTVVSPDKKHIG
ncbi:TerC family protein [Cesiribacter sp. SM1]|uniref:TerC family protein n=1 Tax=Cesiribacter sp. SM1 TaxID=2861196 RepID=UPI001CD4810A|nr:TerC family protein [Cesiribacter sp. SM1]